MDEIILKNENGKVLASSRDVAENFGKLNKHINETIRKLMDENSTVKNMFKKTTYISSRGREEVEYLMDRDGFSLLVMGFTGKKALEWKLKYINAFNTMEEKLKQSNILSEEEKLRLQLFSKDAYEVVQAHNKLVELATAPLNQRIREMKPKEDFHDAVAISENCVNFGKFATNFQNNIDISLGRNKILQYCREHGYLCSSIHLWNKPSQQMIDCSYMQYQENIKERNGKKYITYIPMLTGRGTIWLTKKLTKEFGKSI